MSAERGPGRPPVLEISGVTKAFGERQVLRGVDLDRRASTGRSR